MKTKLIITLLAAFAVSAFAQTPAPTVVPDTVTIQIAADQKEGIANAVDKYNTVTRAALPQDQQAAFVPLTVAQYIQARANDVFASWTKAVLDQRAVDDADLIKAALSLPQAQRDALKAQIQAVTAPK